jgi:3-hydroxyisobutyrate dehydrogenase-like beta-hydroxyacid dehydrogenase
MESAMKRIGFIGVGSMGAPMAIRLVKAGYELTVCDKTSKALDKFREMGVRVTDKPANCADNDIVIVMVVNDSQVKEVVLGPEGILNAVDPNCPPILAIMSTVFPQTTHELAPRCAEKGVRLVDAPVGGMPVAADQGKLAILAGGTRVDLDAIRPVFEIVGENIHHTGPLGCGNITKLVNNIISITNLILSVEAMLVGKQCGMDPSHLASILEKSSGCNFLTKDWERGRATFEFYSQDLNRCKDLIDILRKDLGHAQELAEKVDVACPLLDHVVQAVQRFSYEEMKEKWHAVL